MTSWNPPPDDADPYAQQGGQQQYPQYGQPQYGQPQYGQPQYGQPAYPPPPPYYGGAGRTNGMCIAGFVLAFFCSLLGLIFSIIGLNQAKARNEGGRGLAIAGIVLSILGIIGGIIYVVALANTTAT